MTKRVVMTIRSRSAHDGVLSIGTIARSHRNVVLRRKIRPHLADRGRTPLQQA